uniref:Ovule protein n=1 Tax=Strongyloides venezuelensis TaxID=75913 RepID=A0A0K0G583_STRVS
MSLNEHPGLNILCSMHMMCLKFLCKWYGLPFNPDQYCTGGVKESSKKEVHMPTYIYDFVFFNSVITLNFKMHMSAS